MGSIIALIAALAPSIIGIVQTLLPDKQHNAAKADIVTSAISTILADMQAKGAIPATLDAGQIAVAVETIFQGMKQSGAIAPSVPVAVPAAPGTAPIGGDFMLTFKKGLFVSVG